MKPSSHLFILAVCFFGPHLASAALDAAPSSVTAEVEMATRLQVFLDRANYGPGKIDGHYGGFTEKALKLYRQAHGQEVDAVNGAPNENKPPLPDPKDLDLASVGPAFIDYEVTDADQKTVGELPQTVKAMAKLKWLPYASLAEALAEKFHCDLDFLKQLNPGKMEGVKAGHKIRVPNVEPFDVHMIKDLPLLDLSKNAQDKEPKKESKAGSALPDETVKSQEEIAVKVDKSDNMLRLFEGGKLVAAYPVTIGSEQTQSPLGEWKVRGIARLPDFRYDESFLKTGERGDETYLLSPGPNNPVGVVWIALNKGGIGLHGTNDPDAIGRSASHGCVRLANWDIVRLATRLRAGVAVSIQ
ncbi:L,D-transpeptidase family protein [Prosthecobacter dejongeii]|uniref:Lipoprotein-anchoring transpeptidase ErfK/SrfK n=1 Tax=Prosthecobacter dejongeii TaxID=48465 RepID=A0A7W7YMP6_9BACT|nr:L,D-transpeptidase family protein [Prosthecobacter dejongeii]MBB5039013.1 lipoprotein-anchoring transpeptidase ErfK/SrfK [Prosthecobacter dejongeii]